MPVIDSLLFLDALLLDVNPTLYHTDSSIRSAYTCFSDFSSPDVVLFLHFVGIIARNGSHFHPI